MARVNFKWNDETSQFLVENWNKIALYKLAKEMRTVPETLSVKAKELGLPEYEYKISYWTEEEISKLEELAPEMFYKNIALILGKTPLSVYEKSKKLGIQLIVDPVIWDNEKEKYLLENINKIGITEIGNTIGISYYQTVKKLEELGIEWGKRDFWTEDEVAQLRELAPILPISEIVKEMSRGKDAIIHKAKSLGIAIVT